MENALSYSFMIDPHCHFQYFSNDEISQIITTCKKENFHYFLTNSTCREDFDTSIELSQNFPEILSGIGHHPWYLESLVENDNWFDDFTEYANKLADKGITFFIGEIGIDGGKPKKKVPLDKQIEIFVKQLEFANETNKLVTIHCVYEWEKLYKILEKSSISNLVNNKIILHSFQGTKKMVEKFNKFNPWFSISAGCYSHKNEEMIKAIPADRLILESDSPSMFNKHIYSSEKEYDYYFKDENSHFKNHPMSILSLSKKVSEVKEVDSNEFIKIISNNYKQIIEIIKSN